MPFIECGSPIDCAALGRQPVKACGKGRPPVRQADVKGPLYPTRVEPGIGGTPCRRRILRSRNTLEDTTRSAPGGEAGEDRLSEVRPARLTGRREVKGSSQNGLPRSRQLVRDG